ncbi:MAG TPA: sialidase family protein [Dehalococcoidia bacterium]|nr:sialidase family protein [Dehalococcoidia bacterium]
MAGAAAAGRDTKVNRDYSLRPQNETTIAVNPWSPNMLVGGANDYRLGAPIGAAFYTSFDGGFTWNDGIPPYPLLAVTTGNATRLTETPFGTGDPVLAFGRARAGTAGLAPGTPTVYYAYLGVSASFCEHGIFVSRSTDGLLWSRPVVPPLAPPAGSFAAVYWNSANNCGVFNDKPWLAVDTSGGPHDGRLYVTWSRFVFSHDKYQESPILMTYSDDNGETWSEPLEVSGSSKSLCGEQISGPAGRCDESQFSSVVVGPDGGVHIAFVNQQSRGENDGFRNLYLVAKVDPDTLAVSGPYKAAGLIDGQNDFPANALGQPTLCNSNFRLNSAGNLALDPSDASGNTLYLAFMDNRNGAAFPFPTYVTQEPRDSFACPAGTTTDTDVFIVKSGDGGVSWTSPTGTAAPLRVNQDSLRNGRDQWFPFVAVAPSGRVDVVFYDRREDPVNRLARLYLARSADGGATWTETRISDAPSNMNWAFDEGLFIGDYNALAISPNGTSYPLWADARNGTPDSRQSDLFLDIVSP